METPAAAARIIIWTGLAVATGAVMFGSVELVVLAATTLIGGIVLAIRKGPAPDDYAGERYLDQIRRAQDRSRDVRAPRTW